MRIFMISFLLIAFMGGSAFAQDQKSSPQIKGDNPHIKIMNDKAKRLASSLTTEEAKALGHIRENFGILHSIEVARKSVTKAVSLCSEKNPDLKEEIGTRHQKWHDTLGAVLDKQEIALKSSVNKQRFQNPEQVNDYLNEIDDAAQYDNKKIEKTIVTTMEACKSLMDSMDNTQDVILGMITDMSWPDDEAVPSTAAKP